MKKIIFVCDGGTCRSYMALMFFKNHLKNKKLNINAENGGLIVGENAQPNSLARVALKKHNITTRAKKIKGLTSSDLKKGNFFVTMTKKQKDAFRFFENVFTIGELVGGGEIPDPFGKGQAEYDRIANVLETYTKLLVEKLIKEQLI